MPLAHSASTPPEPQIDAPGAAPATFNFVLYTVALGLLGASAWAAWSIHVNSLPLWRLWFPVVCLVTLLGLLRRVAWGRFLFSCLSLFGALLVVAVLVPQPDDMFEGGSALERLFGTMPPITVCWLLIVISVALVLTPALLLGWRRRWFRSARW